MNRINGVSGMGSMPMNCGMKGMHESQTKIQQENSSISQSNQMSNMKNMPVNCGVKGMHESSPSNRVQASDSVNRVTNTVGSKIDIRV